MILENMRQYAINGGMDPYEAGRDIGDLEEILAKLKIENLMLSNHLKMALWDFEELANQAINHPEDLQNAWVHQYSREAIDRLTEK